MSESSPGRHHEERDIDLAAVLWSGAGLIAIAAVVYLVVWLLFGFLAGREARSATEQYPLAESSRLPPEPRLQTTPRQDLQNLRAREEELLNSYQWTDRPAGTVRIPIKDAMRITLERGLPARPATKETKR